MFDNKVVNTVSDLGESSGLGWRNLRKDEVLNLYFSANIVRIMKLVTIEQSGDVERVQNEIYIYIQF
jgi:hypothetical protein